MVLRLITDRYTVHLPSGELIAVLLDPAQLSFAVKRRDDYYIKYEANKA
jgi:hypothetical protein